MKMKQLHTYIGQFKKSRKEVLNSLYIRTFGNVKSFDRYQLYSIQFTIYVCNDMYLIYSNIFLKT